MTWLVLYLQRKLYKYVVQKGQKWSLTARIQIHFFCCINNLFVDILYFWHHLLILFCLWYNFVNSLDTVAVLSIVTVAVFAAHQVLLLWYLSSSVRPSSSLFDWSQVSRRYKYSPAAGCWQKHTTSHSQHCHYTPTDCT